MNIATGRPLLCSGQYSRARAGAARTPHCPNQFAWRRFAVSSGVSAEGRAPEASGQIIDDRSNLRVRIKGALDPKKRPSGRKPEGRRLIMSSQQADFSIASRGNELAGFNDCQACGIVTALKIERLEIERLVVGAVDMNHLARM